MDPIIGAAITGGISLFSGITGDRYQEAVAEGNAKAARKQAKINIKSAEENAKLAAKFAYQRADYQRLLNYKAADDAWWEEQIRAQEIFEQIAVARIPMLQKVLQLQGRNIAASEGRQGKSSNRINAVEVMGNYGRTKAAQNEQAVRAISAIRRRTGQITDNLEIANWQAYSNATSQANQGLSGYMQAYGSNAAGLAAQSQYQANPMLSIANAAMQGVGFYMQNAAPNAGDPYKGMQQQTFDMSQFKVPDWYTPLTPTPSATGF